MSLNDTPSANRIHIGFFGRRNAGKFESGQRRDRAGPRRGLRPPRHHHRPRAEGDGAAAARTVVMTDTPGFDDDEQELGSKRVRARSAF